MQLSFIQLLQLCAVSVQYIIYRSALDVDFEAKNQLAATAADSNESLSAPPPVSKDDGPVPIEPVLTAQDTLPPRYSLHKDAASSFLQGKDKLGAEGKINEAQFILADETEEQESTDTKDKNPWTENK